ASHWIGIQPPCCIHAAPSSIAGPDFIRVVRPRDSVGYTFVATFARMQTAAPKLSMTQVLACGAMVVTLSMGIRHGFGLWLQPIPQAPGRGPQTFSLSPAAQNLSQVR